MAEEVKKSKDRSPNFPFISLEMALNRAKQFYVKEKRGAAPFKAVAEHWSYSPASSGALQTVGALISYGLMTDEGGARENRSLRLTDLALRIILDQRPGSSERDEYLRQAALNPPVAAEIHEKWPDDLPSPATLHHYLVLGRGFGDQKAHSVIKILLSNQGFALSSLPDVSSHETEMDEDYQIEPRGLVPLPKEAPASTASSNPQPQAQASRPPPERLTFQGAEVLIYFDGEPDWATLDFIEKYMKLRKELIKDKTGTASRNMP